MTSRQGGNTRWLSTELRLAIVTGIERTYRRRRQPRLGRSTPGRVRGHRERAGRFRAADELELATLSWVHWFNENRLHSSIGYLTPIEKENEYYREINSQRQPTLGELALH